MAHPDLDALLNLLYGFAKQMLSKHGEFFPFAASMDKEGKIACVGGDTGDEQPSPNEVIELLEGGLAASAKQGKIRACGICINMQVQKTPQDPKMDAVCARLEHENGQAIEVYMTYRKRRLFKGYHYGSLAATEGKKRIFARE